MKAIIFEDLETRDKNWCTELPSMLWALWTNINRATRDMPFNLVDGADVVHILMKKIRKGGTF
jgi:hypothetical protein